MCKDITLDDWYGSHASIVNIYPINNFINGVVHGCFIDMEFDFDRNVIVIKTSISKYIIKPGCDDIKYFVLENKINTGELITKLCIVTKINNIIKDKKSIPIYSIECEVYSKNSKHSILLFSGCKDFLKVSYSIE